MAKIAAYLLIGIGVGLGVAYWQADDSEPLTAAGTGFGLEDRMSLEARLGEIETELALERYEREALADELAGLRASLLAGDGAEADASDRPESPRERIAAAVNGGDGPFAERVRERFPGGLPQNIDELERARDERQLERYVEAGLSPERAQWIMQREDELRMEVLQAQYDASRSGASREEIANMSLTGLLREELGDADYEKYLEGTGRPTTISVREVLTNSPAQGAGLMPGDEIVAYNGKRVFEMGELNALTYEARPGEAVAIEVLRDGQTMQVYVESGPIGISGGGRATRRDFGGGFRP